MLASVALVNVVPVYRQGLTAALTAEGFAVDEPADLVAWGKGPGPRAILVSIRQLADLDRVRELRAEGLQSFLVALLDDARPHRFGEALLAGADTAAAAAARTEEIVGVVKAALERRASLPMAIAHALAEGRGSPPDESIVSTQEIEWLRAIANDTTVADLAVRAGYSEREMYRALSRLYRRMGVSSRVQALIAAARWGLLD